MEGERRRPPVRSVPERHPDDLPKGYHPAARGQALAVPSRPVAGAPWRQRDRATPGRRDGARAPQLGDPKQDQRHTFAPQNDGKRPRITIHSGHSRTRSTLVVAGAGRGRQTSAEAANNPSGRGFEPHPPHSLYWSEVLGGDRSMINATLLPPGYSPIFFALSRICVSQSTTSPAAMFWAVVVQLRSSASMRPWPVESSSRST